MNVSIHPSWLCGHLHTDRSRWWLVSVPLLVLACGPKPPGPFSDAVVQEYSSMTGLPQEETASAYVVGKAAVVNTGDSLSHHYRTAFTTDDDIEVESGTVSGVHEAIDAPIRAANPGEVNTVIILKWTKVVGATNIVGIEFVQVRCEASVIDRSTRRIVGKQEFAGGIPEGTHRWGSSPQNAIVQWINALPRHAAQTSAVSGAARAAGELADHSVPGSGATGSRETTPGPVRGEARQYVEAANGLSFQYPAAWKQMGPDEARRVMGASTSQYLTVVIYDPEDRTQNVNVQVLPTAAKDLSEASYNEFAGEMDRRMPSDYPDFRKISSRVGRFLDMASLEYVFEATRPDGVRLRQKQLRTGRPGREVAATFTATADLYDRIDATAFKIIVDTLTIK